MLTADDLREALRDLIGDSATGLVLVVLSRVGFCDSSGINAILAGYRTADGLLELLTADSGNLARDASDETAATR
jgi:hypothetical protein